MLEVFQLTSPRQRISVKKKFNPNTMTWIVSDLHSKFEIQNQIMQQQGFFEDQSVLRASELWQLILRRFDPSFKVVSTDFIKTILKEKLSEQKLEADYFVAKHKGEETLLDMINSMIQVIEHPNGAEQIEDWFKLNPGAKGRWGIWFELAKQHGAELLSQKKICQRWIAPWLTNQAGWEQFWSRPLIVDLAGELSRSESELIQILSRTNDVILLEPQTKVKEKFEFLLKPYEEIRGFSKENNASSESASVQPSEHQEKIFRFTSPLAEVKQATATVRKWLESGIVAKNIALISSEVESYWPLLEIYMQEEGIPVAKDTAIKLHSIPIIIWWLSRLRIARKSFEYPDLEISTFHNQNILTIRYEKFEALFKNLLDEGDLSRSQDIKAAFVDDFIPKEAISCLRFLGIISRFWPEDTPLLHLEFVMKEMLQSSDAALQMKFGNWVYWLEHLVGKKEIKIKSGNREGIQIVNLLSADSYELTHRIFLGLTEGQFKDKSRSILSSSDIEKIFISTGFHLNHPEQSSLQFQLEWVSSYKALEDHFYYPMTTTSGAIEAPHSLWLKLAEKREIATQVPEQARFDMIGTQSFAKKIGELRNWDDERVRITEKQILIDNGELVGDQITNFERPILSASSLETYHKCPFKFAAGKLFKLMDPAEVDLDTDARSQGQVVHRLFELLTAEPRQQVWTDVDLAAALNKIYEKLKNEKIKMQEHLGDALLWPPLREKLVHLGQRFIEYEMGPGALLRKKTVGHEVSFKFQFREYEWTGVIDRVDELKSGALVVYDYKARNREYKIKKWIEKQHLQLGFYAWAIEKGFAEKFSNQIIAGALYYIYRDFTMLGIDPTAAESNTELKKFFTELEVKIENFISGLNSGNFPAVPHKEEECKYCKWSRLCRAAHLN